MDEYATELTKRYDQQIMRSSVIVRLCCPEGVWVAEIPSFRIESPFHLFLSALSLTTVSPQD